jgi:hypothetical protein
VNLFDFIYPLTSIVPGAIFIGGGFKKYFNRNDIKEENDASNI